MPNEWKLHKRGKYFYRRRHYTEYDPDGTPRHRSEIVSLKTTSLAEAKQKILRKNAEDAGLVTIQSEQPVPSLGDIRDDFLEWSADPDKHSDAWHNSVRWYIGAHFGEYVDGRRFDQIPLDQISAGTVEKWQRKIRRKPSKYGGTLSAKTVNKVTGIVRSMFNYAMRNNIVTPAQVPFFPRLREIDEVPRWFTIEECKALLTVTADDMDNGRFVRLGLMAGLRRAEILSLRCCDVDRESGQLLIRAHDDDGFQPKSRKARMIPVHRDLWPYLEHTESGRYYPATRRTFRSEYRKPWEAIMEAAAIDPWATPHALRHTFGTTLAATPGVTAFDIQQLMGHSTVKMSERYIHLVGGHQSRRAINRLLIPELN